MGCCLSDILTVVVAVNVLRIKRYLQTIRVNVAVTPRYWTPPPHCQKRYRRVWRGIQLLVRRLSFYDLSYIMIFLHHYQKFDNFWRLQTDSNQSPHLIRLNHFVALVICQQTLSVLHPVINLVRFYWLRYLIVNIVRLSRQIFEINYYVESSAVAMFKVRIK